MTISKKTQKNIDYAGSFFVAETAKRGLWNLSGALSAICRDYQKPRMAILSLIIALILAVFIPIGQAVLISIVFGVAGFYLIGLVGAIRQLKEFGIPMRGNFKEQFLKCVLHSGLNKENTQLTIDLITKHMEIHPEYENYNFYVMRKKQAEVYLHIILGYDDILKLFEYFPDKSNDVS